MQGKRSWHCAAIAAVGLACLLCAAPSGAGAGGGDPGTAANPFAGDGSWIWYVSSSGGSPQAVARIAKRNGLETVYVKSSDARTYWSQFSPELVRALHRRGIAACAWAFVYGDSPGREARVSARAVESGADCLVIDAEGSYEGRYRQAYRYINSLRRRIGDEFPLGLSSFPYVDYHPTFPYSVFLAPGMAEANLPQIYWKAIGTTVRAAFAHTYSWNRAYDRPIYPLGQTWQDPGKRQILDFRRYAREYGSEGVSWWSWQETNKREWRLTTRRIKRGIPGFDASPDYARLQRGDTGDPVLLAQELLRAWGSKITPDGAFGAKMKLAVRNFQAEHELRASGRIGDSTWQLLGEREPQSTNWRREKVPKALARAARPQARASRLSPGGAWPPTLGMP